ncbi:MCE family protein [Thermomonospora umbrina]|uniref:Phospholipid/cholesterol/gamma-HCH transport system substrate-binding protein n=1 Tax=Thermomonospora umbrina TaxID=111806 RepID=A0A3D9SMA7_9ACTN|nr:MCE family protein [Thermomonospora umbrina]REE95540.1 phospholipid/cholesterol/gamma-HCH transport system substrate-binding protein [Thermomonospora umbrina]
MRRRIARRISRTAVAALAMTMLAGCSDAGFRGVYDLPLPGGADVGDDPYEVTAQFDNVLSLTPHASVRVNDVAVGRVTAITLPKAGWQAQVAMVIDRDVRLPANAVARLEQSSLLGEKYVQLAPPPRGTARGTLGDGAVIPVDHTNRYPEVEEIFGAMSMLLNGGGLAQMRTITRELNRALEGNEPEIRSMLRRLNEFTSTLDEHSDDITDALDGINRLSATLNARRRQINLALDDLSPGLKVLEDQRGQLMTMLKALGDFGDVMRDVLDESKEDMVADLKALAPILRRLSDAGRALPQSLEVLLTYPFTDEVLNVVKGDYLNVYLSVSGADGTTIIPPFDQGEKLKAPKDWEKALKPAPLPLPSVGTPRTTPRTPRSGGDN